MKNARWDRFIGDSVARETGTRSGHTATLCGQNLVIVGGGTARTSNIPDFNIAVLNVRSNRWTIGDLGLPAKYHTATLVDDKVYCIGGGNDGIEGTVDRQMEVLEVDLLALRLRKVVTYLSHPEHMPSHTWKHVAEFFEAKREIVVHGGRPKVETAVASNQLYALDVDSKTWRKLSYHGVAPREQSSHMTCLNHSGDSMFLSASSVDNVAAMELYRFDYRGKVPKWERIQTLGKVPPGVFGGCLNLLHGRYLVLFGGVLRNQYISDLYIHDLHTSRWIVGVDAYAPSQAQDTIYLKGFWPPLKSRHAGVVSEGKVIYIGGGGVVNQPLHMHYKLSFDSEQ